MGRLRPFRPPATAPLTDDALAAIQHGCRQAFASSLAKGSRKNVDRTGRLYSQFCTNAGLQAWPLSVQSVSFFMVDYVHRGNSPESLMDGLSRLKRFTLEQGFAWLSERQLFYIHNIRTGLRRLFKEPVVRAAPCTMAILQRLAGAAHPADPMDIMVVTMCFVAHNGLMRGGELLGLQVADLRWDTPNRTACSLGLVESKANQFGAPEWIPLEDFGSDSGCGFLRDYVARFGIDQRHPSSPLFPAYPWVSTCTSGISHKSFAHRFRQLLDRAGLPPAGYTGHSFRSGGATDLYNGQCRPHTIRLQGRWLSEAIWIYVRDCPESRRTEVAEAFSRIAHLYA